MPKKHASFGTNRPATYAGNHYVGVWAGFFVPFSVLKAMVKEFLGLGLECGTVVRASALLLVWWQMSSLLLVLAPCHLSALFPVAGTWCSC